jgi:hypothetical protein
VPFTEWVAWALPLTLANAGRINEARDAIAEMNRKWPDNPDVYFKWVEFTVESQRPPFAQALALLDDPAFRNFSERPPIGKPGTMEVWRNAIQARLGPPATKRAAAQLVERSVDDGKISVPSGIWILSSLGDVDGAFRLADRSVTTANLHRLFGTDLGIGNTYLLLFGTQTAEMRRDQRFMPLAQRLGLISYWRSTGHWPDFCSETGLPYDCKVVAAKLAATASQGQTH